MKVLFIGDIVGKSGRNALREHLPFLREKYQPDIVIVNGENSAHGKGITRKIYDLFVELGVDCVTLGNHAFSKDNILTFINSADRLIRPANMFPASIGKPYLIIEKNDLKVGIYNIYGSIFMDNCTESPFSAMDKLIDNTDCDIRIVDFHGEATSEKQAFMHYFKDRVQLIVGTHTHVQTADEDIFDGCGYLTDVGMTGPYLSVLGRDVDEVLDMMVSGEKTRYTVSENPAILCGLFCEISDSEKKAKFIERIQIKPEC
ncbi:MAG: TIGR00282 family metallophosphoesterase [Erysipelotrichaceae bacterium]|nr:TIGR00282 family metallophosphoesterase [Erysipelotrichaceae bacterium]